MKTSFYWIIAAAILLVSSVIVFYTLSPEEKRLAPIVSDPISDYDSIIVIPQRVIPQQPEGFSNDNVPNASWCEPIYPPPCVAGSECSPAPDGTERVCIRKWYDKDPEADEFACSTKVPSLGIQSWRKKRLRVLIDHICIRKNKCDSKDLFNYLAVLVLRESTWRPFKSHRLSPDITASETAWERRKEVYSSNPVFEDFFRFSASYGYYGQSTPNWLDKWDVNAIPEVLCGEVESTIVHLRAVRKRWSLLSNGITCQGKEFHGTSHNGTPSWYDLSLVNSGSESCPATSGKPLEVRNSFQKRARSRGLDSYAPVTLKMLGDPIPRDTQDQWSAKMRRQMDQKYPQL